MTPSVILAAKPGEAKRKTRSNKDRKENPWICLYIHIVLFFIDIQDVVYDNINLPFKRDIFVRCLLLHSRDVVQLEAGFN